MAKATLKNLHRLISMATTTLPPEELFLADLKVAIEKLDRQGKHTPSRSYKPSSMQCVRNMYYQVTGEPCDPEGASSELVGICESGSSRHEQLQNVIYKMKKLGMDWEYINVADFVLTKGLDYLDIVKMPNPEKGEFETKLYHKNFNISFLCDGILKHGDQYFVLEIKTESVYKWQSREFVADDHLDQATTYSICFGIDDILFLYESRDTCSKKSYMLHVTDEMKMGIVAKIEESDRHVKLLTPPPIPKDVSKKACSYCNYKTPCKKAGN